MKHIFLLLIIITALAYPSGVSSPPEGDAVLSTGELSSLVLTSDGTGSSSWVAAGAPGAHGSTHEDGGGDEVDVELAGGISTLTPANYTTSTAEAGCDATDQLCAHLKGIDNALAAGAGATTALDNLASVQINTNLTYDNTGNKELNISDEATADANQAPTLTIRGSNKTAGTGRGGNVDVITGTSAGSTIGDFNITARQILIPDGSAGVPAIAFASETGTGFRKRGGGLITIQIQGTNEIDITSTLLSPTTSFGSGLGSETSRWISMHAAAIITRKATTTNLTADNTALSMLNVSFKGLSSDSGTATDRTFTVTSCLDGQRVTLLWEGANAGEMLITSTQRLSATWLPLLDDTLSFICDGTNIYETARSDN